MVLLVGKTGHITVRSRQARDYAECYRVVYCHKYNRDNRCRLLRRKSRRRSNCENGIDLKPDEFRRDLSVTFASTLCPTNFDRYRPIFDPTKFAQPLDKRGDPWGVG